MRRRKRVICWLLCLLAAASVLIGCDGRGADTELDISDWQSWRIGTPLAWSSDYYLSEQVRIPHLYLYDSIGDCIMALRFGYVDAIAVDALYAYSMVAEYSDLVIQDEPIGEDSLVAYITNARRDILEQMNAYIPKLKASETYTDMVERANAEEFVTPLTFETLSNRKVVRGTFDEREEHDDVAEAQLHPGHGDGQRHEHLEVAGNERQRRERPVQGGAPRRQVGLGQFGQVFIQICHRGHLIVCLLS